ncbi:MAG: acetyl-CoA carboxylase biotin carboxyl carrier protein subunit [Bacteroides sp.]|nr:acetyl-CoA carboxylase biotin carboxyl carrier protein subunit [Bacteroides sp.]MDD2645039.1 acetyl-CoA carboxylase biotin carboxyl carrier protein subunit [Bacteroides sp.]MDD4055882.1 acetyl-CoA carboxylase biotin carboxyl carrier protein subunit [Bacteroides sp.]MDD4720807.1 acetyl-CoA carboxylase biotin carboxyl carrier protein subunit [Bacteroides sp.]NLI64299.1 acetyl-CoA carboxylase biotin carboxyl carrier protein subunit [Bacteroidales bacterium]
MEAKKFIAVDKNNMQEYSLEINSEGEIFINGQKCEVEFTHDDSGLNFVHLKGNNYTVEIVSNDQNNYELLINGNSYTFSLETPFSLEKLKKKIEEEKHATTYLIKAPMPGTILEVNVEQNDSINSGETALVLEAMKMENAIAVDHGGIVTKVFVKKGDIISKNAPLVEIKREKI